MKKELFKKSNHGTGLVASVQPYKYTGKELDRETGLDWYDSQARMYDPATGHTTTMDPMCEKYYPMSPYLWCGGNPVRHIDKDGRHWVEDKDGSVVWLPDVNGEVRILQPVDLPSIMNGHSMDHILKCYGIKNLTNTQKNEIQPNLFNDSFAFYVIFLL